MLSCMALWFVGNSIEGALLQTGAFEIELNGKMNSEVSFNAWCPYFHLPVCVCDLLMDARR